MAHKSGSTRSLITPLGVRRAAIVLVAVAVGISVSGGIAGAKEPKHHKPKSHVTRKGKESASSELGSLSASLSNFQNGTFKATYTFTSGSQMGTITIEQEPPKTAYTVAGPTGGGSFISTGSTAYFCSSSTPVTCISESSTANPLAGLLDLFDPSTYKSDLSAAEQALAAKESGYTVSVSTATIAGQASKCAAVSGPAGSGKYCVTNSGILASVSTATASFTLSSFSRSVSPTDFAPPAGATVETIP